MLSSSSGVELFLITVPIIGAKIIESRNHIVKKTNTDISKTPQDNSQQ